MEKYHSNYNLCLRYHWIDFDIIDFNFEYNSLRPSDAYMRQLSNHHLTPDNASRLVGVKPSSEPTLEYLLLIGRWVANFNETLIEIYRCLFLKCIWKCRLQKRRPFQDD